MRLSMGIAAVYSHHPGCTEQYQMSVASREISRGMHLMFQLRFKIVCHDLRMMNAMGISCMNGIVQTHNHEGNSHGAMHQITHPAFVALEDYLSEFPR